MRKKFIGPPNPGPDGTDAGYDVAVAGTRIGTVASGGVLDIPDDLAQEAAASAWPDALWQDARDKDSGTR